MQDLRNAFDSETPPASMTLAEEAERAKRIAEIDAWFAAKNSEEAERSRKERKQFEAKTLALKSKPAVWENLGEQHLLAIEEFILPALRAGKHPIDLDGQQIDLTCQWPILPNGLGCLAFTGEQCSIQDGLLLHTWWLLQLLDAVIWVSSGQTDRRTLRTYEAARKRLQALTGTFPTSCLTKIVEADRNGVVSVYGENAWYAWTNGGVDGVLDLYRSADDATESGSTTDAVQLDADSTTSSTAVDKV